MFQFFSVAYRYIHDDNNPANKLYRLKALIDELHRGKMHVIFDGVFEAVNAGSDRAEVFPITGSICTNDSPFVGSAGQFFANLDYDNACTEDFIRDVYECPARCLAS